MNKIIITKDKNISIDKDSYIIIDDNIKLKLEILKKTNIFIFINNKNITLNIDVKATSTINIFSINASINIDIKLLKAKTNLNYNYSTINIKGNKYFLNINHLADNTNCVAISHGLNLDDNKLDFQVDTNIPNSAFEINSYQDSKIILKGKNNSIIKPNLFVDNSKIEANHSAYIGHFKENELFYLQTRGLSKNEAEKLLAKAFLINKMKLSFDQQNLIIKNIEEKWR